MKIAFYRSAVVGILFAILYVLLVKYVGVTIVRDYWFLYLAVAGFVSVIASPEIFKKTETQE